MILILHKVIETDAAAVVEFDAAAVVEVDAAAIVLVELSILSGPVSNGKLVNDQDMVTFTMRKLRVPAFVFYSKYRYAFSNRLG